MPDLKGFFETAASGSALRSSVGMIVPEMNGIFGSAGSVSARLACAGSFLESSSQSCREAGSSPAQEPHQPRSQGR
jgi:hypothetical protein